MPDNPQSEGPDTKAIEALVSIVLREYDADPVTHGVIYTRDFSLIAYAVNHHRVFGLATPDRRSMLIIIRRVELASLMSKAFRADPGDPPEEDGETTKRITDPSHLPVLVTDPDGPPSDMDADSHALLITLDLPLRTDLVDLQDRPEN